MTMERSFSESDKDDTDPNGIHSGVRKKFSKFIGRFSLKTVLTGSLIVILICAMGITGILLFINSQYAVNELASQLQGDISYRITEQLDYYLATPHHLNQLCQYSMRIGDINIHDSEDIKRHFQELSYQYKTVQAICYGNEEDGNYSIVSIVGKPGVANGTERFWAVSPVPTQNDSYEEYRIDRDGRIIEKTLSYPNYDPRTRSWYQTAESTGGPAWTPIYMWLEVDAVSLDALLPVYSKQGVLQGVLDTSLTLSGITDFLKRLNISKNGQAFIIERTGLIVASSTMTRQYTKVNDELVRLSSFDSNDSVIKKASMYLRKSGESQINKTVMEQYSFDIDDRRYYAQVTPYHDEYGLDWLIVVVIPESDFMDRIYANNQITLLLIISSIIGATIICILLARWITQPILSMNRSARSLASGRWVRFSSIDRKDELGELSNSFKYMADQIQVSFSALQSSEERYLSLFQSSADAILILEDLVVKNINKAAINLFKVQMGDVCGREVQTLFGEIGTVIADLIRSGPDTYPDSDTGDVSYRSSQSEPRILKILLNPIDTTNGLIYQVLVRDITEQRKACLAYAEREAFHEAYMQMQSILDLLPDPTFIIDPQGSIILWNQAMTQLTNIPADFMIGKGDFEYSLPLYGVRRRMLIDYALHPDDTIRELYPGTEYQGDLLSTQYWFESKGGKRYVSSTAGRLYDSRKNLIGAIESIRDITEIKKAHEALIIANKKLNLLSQISRHDILNKITILNGLLYLMTLEYDDPEMKEKINKLLRIINVIQGQIDFTREYQKIGTIEPEWLNPIDLFKKQQEFFVENPIEFTATPSDMEIYADPLFNKVIYNLIDNSIRHGETVSRIRFSVVQKEKGAEILYEDNGTGISQEEKKIIFEPNYGKNTGYGLFLIKEILLITGISIEESGEQGKGARFVMIIPRGGYRLR